jgi:hypothetical protein
MKRYASFLFILSVSLCDIKNAFLQNYSVSFDIIPKPEILNDVKLFNWCLFIGNVNKFYINSRLKNKLSFNTYCLQMMLKQ